MAVPVDGGALMEDERPAKRPRTAGGAAAHKCLVEADACAAIPPHPLRIKPAGNAFAAATDLRSHAGEFAKLPDELISLLLEFLEARELLQLGHTCKALYAFTTAEDFWKTLFIERAPKAIDWRGSWRATYLGLPLESKSAIDCNGLYSDVLYRPFQCAHTPFEPYTTEIPTKHVIPRMSNLSSFEYSTSWFNKPFILTSPVKSWPIYGKWTIEHLVQHYPELCFRAEAVDWPLRAYVAYMRNQADESPLYLFDRGFADKMGLKVGRAEEKADAAYWPPDCFGDDLFAVLGEQRPDHCWLIVGPARSGSTFHKDPNATSAWNAVLTGSKYWLMFPGGSSAAPPPGVILSGDASEITSPISIAEYLLAFHALARATPGCREGICHAGEILHVPSGWFHLVLNLEESIAITQNFVPEQKLADVLRFLRDSPDQISGFVEEISDPYSLFVERLRERYPEMLQAALNKLDKSNEKKSRWAQVKERDHGAKAGGFSFGFGGNDEDVEIP